MHSRVHAGDTCCNGELVIGGDQWSVADAWVGSNRHCPNRKLLESDGLAVQEAGRALGVWPWWPSWGWEARLPWWGCVGRFCHLASHLVPLGAGERQIRILALGLRNTGINPLACWPVCRCRICRNGRAARCARAASPPIASVAPEAPRLRLDTSVLGFTQVGGLAFLVDTG